MVSIDAQTNSSEAVGDDVPRKITNADTNSWSERSGGVAVLPGTQWARVTRQADLTNQALALAA